MYTYAGIEITDPLEGFEDYLMDRLFIQLNQE